MGAHEGRTDTDARLANLWESVDWLFGEGEAAGRNRRLLDDLGVMGAGVVLLSDDRKVRYQSALMRERFGDQLGEPCYKALRGSSEPCLSCGLETGTGDEDCELATTDGRIYHLRGVRRNGDDGLGGPTLLLLLERTERERRQQERVTESAFFRDFVEHSPDMCFSISAKDGRILHCNRAAVEKLGYRLDDLLDMTLFELCPPERCEEVRGHFAGFLEAGHLRDVETCLRRKDGRDIEVSFEATAARDDEGRITHGRAVCRDVSARKQAERRLKAFEAQVQHTQKLESLGLLAGGIAHDFSNLLMGVLGNADLALGDLSLSSSARDDILSIRTAAQRAAELCKQLLAYSGKGKFVVARVDLSALVEEMVQLLTVAIAKNVVVKYNLAPHLPAVHADATQIRQVIMNLITNASEAIGERSGVVSVTTGAMDCDEAYLREVMTAEGLSPGTYVFLEVADTGCGMDDATRDRLFDPFFTTKFTGRGLGLAAVLGIVRGHGGAVKVYSELGKGTTFKILLPSGGGAAEALRPLSTCAESWTSSGLALIIDDDETVRAVAGRLLERIGFRVLVAQDGIEGLAVYREHREEIRFVLLDMTMPHMNGPETFTELRRLNPKVIVVLSSGYNEQDAVAQFTGKGLAGFIHKPYELKVLRQRLRSVLEGDDEG